MVSLGKRKVVVDVSGGKIKGKVGSKGRLTHHLGIPYAAPPVGARRWKAPAPVEPWRGTEKCTSFGPGGYQRPAGMSEFFDGVIAGIGLGRARAKALATAMKFARTKQSEDCLTINVHAPVGAEALPVMVWIHGGDHTDGDSSMPTYNSPVFPERGCVLVTFNYRLGLMGFFAHPDLAVESPDGVSGNYGLLDQIAALEWVRDNIAAFGGDPARVTIFGESAGGEAVLNLMTSPRARAVPRAIAQSPSDSGRWLHLRRPALDFISVEDAVRRVRRPRRRAGGWPDRSAAGDGARRDVRAVQGPPGTRPLLLPGGRRRDPAVHADVRVQRRAAGIGAADHRVQRR